jgi:hypothetical protein
VALPTFRQARRARRLDPAGRELLHSKCPHRELNCPIEAAWTATYNRMQLVKMLVLLALVWSAVFLIGLFAPNWQSKGASGYPSPVWGLAFMAAAGGSYFGLKELGMEHWHDPDGPAACAASGPDIDPWSDLGL